MLFKGRTNIPAGPAGRRLFIYFPKKAASYSGAGPALRRPAPAPPQNSLREAISRHQLYLTVRIRSCGDGWLRGCATEWLSP